MSLAVKGLDGLQQEVIQAELCTVCGACAGMCPYIVSYKGRVAYLDTCDLSESRCYTFCPRTAVNLDQVSEQTFGTPYQLNELGTVKEIALVRSTDERVRSRAQYGGAVSTLISLALDEGAIDGAVLTASDRSLLPQGKFVRNSEEVLECAGSSYVASPTIETFNVVAKGDEQRIGVVGTPCQALALGKMKVSTLENKNNIDKLKLVIGLFCTWGLSYLDFVAFLKQRLDTNEVKKFDIPPPPADIFVVYTDHERIVIPLEEVRQFILPSCSYCLDMTAEFADLSVGAAEGIEGWNTVIVRSVQGKELYEKAKAKGLIEVAPFPSANLEHLKWASLNKKKRALKNIVDKSGSKDNLLYLEGSLIRRKEFLSLLQE